MNDRFNFRAWSKRIEKFIYNIQDVGVDFSIECWEDCFGDFLNNENYIIEQCTSLKDKNGKLIYEGDRVKFNKNGNRKGCIIWYLSSWGIETTSEFIPMEGQFAINDPRDIEVIGNIHENPELLENEE